MKRRSLLAALATLPVMAMKPRNKGLAGPAINITGVNYIANQAGEFWYSGAPATGNLIMSIASSGGTDDFGNTYLVGANFYNNTAGTFTGLSGAQILLGLIAAAGLAGAISTPNNGQVSITSGGTSAGDTENTVRLASKGAAAGGTAGVAISDTGQNPQGIAVLEVYNTIFVNNRAGAPATPSGGGILYTQAGALKYIGSSGTITTLGPA